MGSLASVQSAQPETVRDERERKVGYNGQKCEKIPVVLANLFGMEAVGLDLSYNRLTTLEGLNKFPVLKELILDSNFLPDTLTFPYLPSLHTLSLNKNNICDLQSLVQKIKLSFPNIVYLSLLGNKACPNELSGEEHDQQDYQRYRDSESSRDRQLLSSNHTQQTCHPPDPAQQPLKENPSKYYIIYHLPTLKFLDSNRINKVERCEAARRGKFMNIIRPTEFNTNGNALESSVSNSLTPLPICTRSLTDQKGAYGKCRYRYSGKQSEGNRFISNSDL
ncbi:hypothetical protein NQ315_002522 [Exocentrus adspersus]|uniref:Leucine-rich melanocyte differentiation-associated protein n=1 Tax=Exocentrus adspersus TaxID=1586481 RepID=A0AAV8VL88_9CUCU|nr:hypothetical protein NQ315_002522 [Exocentrus adspersus]